MRYSLPFRVPNTVVCNYLLTAAARPITLCSSKQLKMSTWWPKS